MEKGLFTRRWNDHGKADRALCYGILALVFLVTFVATGLIRAYAAEYSFTKYEYHKLIQNTCLMGQRVMDTEGELFRVISLKGVKLVKDGETIGETTAFFGVNQDGDKAVLNIYSEISSNSKTSRTIIVLADTDLDGKPNQEGDGHQGMYPVTEDGKTNWNVWIVRFIEEVI